MKRITDERLLMEKRLVNSKAFGYTLIALWGIIYYRLFYLEQDLTEFLDIFLLTIGASAFVTIGNIVKGNYLTYREVGERNKVVYVSSVVAGFAFVAVQTIILRPNLSSWLDYLYLAIEVVVFIVVWIVLQRIIIHRSNLQINKKIEE